MASLLGKRKECPTDNDNKQLSFNDMRNMLNLVTKNANEISLSIPLEYTEFFHDVCKEWGGNLLRVNYVLGSRWKNRRFTTQPYMNTNCLPPSENYLEIAAIWNKAMETMIAYFNWEITSQPFCVPYNTGVTV